jgi:TonB family protein
MNLRQSSPIVQIVHAAGWTLIHFVWQGVLVAIILACALTLLNGKSARPRYLAACTALVLMAMLPLMTFTCIIVSEQNVGGAVSDGASFRIASIGGAITSFPEPFLNRIAAALDHAMPAAVVLWLAGVFLFSFRLSLGLITVRRMIAAATPPESHELVQAFLRVVHRVELTLPVRLLQSTLVQVPTVIGWLRPVILLPLGCFSGLSPIQIEAILAHEIAHIRRRDYLVSVLQSAVEALLFYHPAVWLISRRVRIEREHCCDDLAVQYTGNALVYARALSLLGEHRSALPAVALGANGGVLTMRIQRLLRSKESARTPQVVGLTILCIVIVIIVISVTITARAQDKPTRLQGMQQIPIAATKPYADARGPASRRNQDPAANAGPQTAESTPASPAIPSQYQAWIDQDVRWLILPQERAAFYQLTSDAERDRFIEQFWEKRNSPGSAPNSYRAEHYRRISYANQHFAGHNLAGWETDRGHIYVVDGPPSSIEAHPSSAPYGHAYEKWGYPAMQVTFVDLCDCGNHQLLAQVSPGSKYQDPVADILSDTQGVDFRPYMKQALQMMGDRWPPSAPAGEPHNAHTETVIRFTISRDGDVSAMVLVESAHSIEVDRAAWAAIASVGKFPSLPAEFNGPNLVLRVSFGVNAQ